MSEGPARVYDSIKEGFLRYVDTAFWLRDEGLREERRRLLEEPGLIFTDPLIEPIPPYAPDVPIADVCQEIGLSEDLAESLARVVFNRDASFRLYAHQAAAFRASMRGRGTEPINAVVTAGTGAGKTEAFLLPVFARLLAEASSWEDSADEFRWWDASLPDQEWQDIRSGSSRTTAVRAMVLYPTNALVEDQMTRLRSSVRRARQLEKSTRLYFGRYTGATIGNRDHPRRTKTAQAREVALHMQALEADRDSVVGNDQDLIAQLPDPRQGEMITRWDMIESPPDVLVTNYSMLNVMMMREREDPIFDKTAEWLRADGTRVFTLIVDELHLYRGTHGSEVALIVRNLLQRLGLGPDSAQLRCIATSASLDDSSGTFMQEFFGVEQSTFTIIPGTPEPIREVGPLPRARCAATSRRDSDDAAAEMDELITDLDLRAAVAAGCRDADSGELRPISLPELDSAIFDAPPTSADDGALDVALQAIERSTPDPSSVRFRVHMFMRTVRGLWACSNPSCDGVDESLRSPSRRIGKLHPIPTHACDRCGARVLELLYCFQCGDVSLGGFATTPEGENGGDYWYLSATPSGTDERTRQDIVFRRRWGEYMWYWPAMPDRPHPGWGHTPPGSDKPLHFGFLPARYNHVTGVLEPEPLGNDATGTMFNAPDVAPDSGLRIPALPQGCPRCFQSGWNSDPVTFFHGTVRSEIRAHTTGVAITSQLITDRLLDALGSGGEQAQTIVFTDSRDDAATTAAGLELNHFRDLIRQLIHFELGRAVSPAELLDKAARGEATAEEQELVEPFKRQHPDVSTAYALRARGVAGPDEHEAIRLFETQQGGDGLTWGTLLLRLQDRLLRLGVNPGRPGRFGCDMERQAVVEGLRAAGSPMGSPRTRARQSRRRSRTGQAGAPCRGCSVRYCCARR